MRRTRFVGTRLCLRNLFCWQPVAFEKLGAALNTLWGSLSGILGSQGRPRHLREQALSAWIVLVSYSLDSIPRGRDSEV